MVIFNTLTESVTGEKEFELTLLLALWIENKGILENIKFKRKQKFKYMYMYVYTAFFIALECQDIMFLVGSYPHAHRHVCTICINIYTCILTISNILCTV